MHAAHNLKSNTGFPGIKRKPILSNLSFWSGEQIKSGILIYIVTTYCILFGFFGIFIDISKGHYALKIPLMILIASLIFSKKSYSFLIGILIPCYFVLKGFGSNAGTGFENNYQISFSHIVVFIMAISLFVRTPNEYGYNASTKLGLPFFMLAGIVFISIVGFINVNNIHLYAKRIVELIGLLSSYYVGKKITNNYYGHSRLLLLGLLSSLFAFTAPWTIGMVVRDGVSVLSNLDAKLNDVGAQSSAVEAGTSLLIFAFSYSLSYIAADIKVKLLAVSTYVFASAATLFFLSKAAISLMVVVVIGNVFMSSGLDVIKGKRLKTVIIMLFFTGLFITLLFIFAPGLLDSITNRFSRIDRTADGRLFIYSKAFEVAIENIIFGIGAGQFKSITNIWHAHNDTLNMFAEQGLLGMILYLTIMIFFGTLTFKLYIMKRDYRLLSIIYGSVFIAYFGYSQIEIMLSNRGALLLFFISGWIVNTYQNRHI